MKATIKTHPIIETEIFYCESVSYASDYELGRFIPQYDEKVLSGYLTKKAKIHEAILGCDKWINVPILKNHGGAKMTVSMKNYMGIVWDREYFHSNNLQQCIADICTFNKRPVLNIVDGYRIMTQNGPKGKTENDTMLAKALFISPNIVAVDTAAIKFFSQFKEMDISRVGHIAFGEAQNLGTTDLDKLKIKRIKI